MLGARLAAPRPPRGRACQLQLYESPLPSGRVRCSPARCPKRELNESTLDQSGSGSDIATRLVVRPRWPSTLTGTPQEQFRCELLYGYGLVLLSS